jgi:hypothetical protein
MRASVTRSRTPAKADRKAGGSASGRPIDPPLALLALFVVASYGDKVTISLPTRPVTATGHVNPASLGGGKSSSLYEPSSGSVLLPLPAVLRYKKAQSHVGEGLSYCL